MSIKEMVVSKCSKKKKKFFRKLLNMLWDLNTDTRNNTYWIADLHYRVRRIERAMKSIR